MTDPHELTFKLIELNCAMTRLVVWDGPDVVQIFESDPRSCLNELLKVVYQHGLSGMQFTTRIAALKN